MGTSESGTPHTANSDGHPYRIGNLIAERFRVMDIHGGEGKSSMGVVYHCIDTREGQPVALKTLQKRFLSSKKVVDSFKKEALAWICLEEHPNIVRAHWVRELDGLMFIACDFIEPDWAGRNTLSHHLKAPFSLKTVLTWAIQFCHGMEYARGKGVTPHRDIKPDNLMITSEGILKITDFGLAGLLQNDPAHITGGHGKGPEFLASGSGRIVAGSPPWMAPEQFFGVAEERSDIYSFGVVLFQLVSAGTTPFQPRKGDTWAMAHKTYPLPPIPEQGKPLSQVLCRCTEKQRQKRYDHFGELREDLEKIFRKEIAKKTGEPAPNVPELQRIRTEDRINKGLSLANLGLVDDGIRNYREALRSNPRNVPALFNLAVALAKKSLMEDAITEYRKVVALAPDMTAAHFNLAAALVRTGRIDEAISEFKETLRTKPVHTEARLNLGMAYEKKGCRDLAIAEFSEAVKTAPDSPRAHNALGTALFREGRFDDAVGAFGKALRADPAHPDAYFNIAMAFARQDLLVESLRALEEFRKRARPDDVRRAKAEQLIMDLKKRIGVP